ncbi:hypothetical protein KKH63_02965 [Patescibacteria group bacterium]|nr:hypothetical protein [Patescibacteria group bacterium]
MNYFSKQKVLALIFFGAIFLIFLFLIPSSSSAICTCIGVFYVDCKIDQAVAAGDKVTCRLERSNCDGPCYTPCDQSSYVNSWAATCNIYPGNTSCRVGAFDCKCGPHYFMAKSDLGGGEAVTPDFPDYECVQYQINTSYGVWGYQMPDARLPNNNAVYWCKFNYTPPAPTTYSLSVSKAGAGSGTVTSNPAGINCGSTCSASFNSGTSVTLTAAAATGSTFTGWSGAGCSGTGTCTVSMTAARAVTATFTLNNSPPVANFSCTPTNCIVYMGENLTLNNNSSDPDNNLARSEWDILNWGSAPDLTCCASGCNSTTILCNYTVQSSIVGNGTYNIRLTVRDAQNATSNLTKTFNVKLDISADFVCSEDNASWQACNSIDFRPPRGSTIYFHDNLSDAILTPLGLAGRRSIPSEGASISQRVWKKAGVTFNSGNNSNPSLEMTDAEADISLQITDTASRSASANFHVIAGAPLPEWQEIIPIVLRSIKDKLASLIFSWQ